MPRRPAHRFVPEAPAAVQAVLLDGIPSRLPPPDGLAAWGEAAEVLGTAFAAGVAAEAAARHGIRLAPEAVHRVRRRAREEAVASLELERSVPDLFPPLRRAGVRAILTKGPGLAALDPRLCRRAYTDLDVLVPGNRIRDAARVLEDAGFREVYPEWEPRRGFRYRYRHSVPMRRGRINVDLHHAIPPIVFGRRIPFDRLWDEAGTLIVGGAPVRVPSRRHAALVAALHVLSSAGGSWLRPWRDAAALLSDDAHAAPTAAEALRFRLALPLSVVTGAMDEAWGIRSAITDILHREGGPLSDRARVWAMSWRRPWAEHQVEEMVRLPAPLLPGFAIAFAFPDRAFLEARYPGLADRSLARLYGAWWGSSLGRIWRVVLHRPLPHRLPDERTAVRG